MINYSTDGSGRWWKTEWAEQCSEKGVFVECQGVVGHKGVHWSFNKHGSFCYNDNKADPSENGCSGSIPPDHKHYRTPLEMSSHYYMSHSTYHEVLDIDLINRLEKGEMLDGESLDRPYNFAESGHLSELDAELLKRMEDYKDKGSGKPRVE